MNIPCDKAISCDAGLQALGYDFPVANFSSERPDQAIVIGVNYGWDANAAPLGQVWSTPGCVSWCTSQVSQDEADLCAARQQLACAAGIGGGPDIPPGGDGSSNPNTPPPGSQPPGKEQMFRNSEQNCSTKCPDGTVITETVASGEVIARSQILADEIAKTTACKRLAAKAICTSGLDGFACADPFFEDNEYKHQFTATGAAPLVWTVAGGSLPPQLVLEPSGLLHGTPDTAGDYNFTVRVTNATGQTADRDCTFHVLGLDITQKALPEAKVDHPYNYVLPGKGGAMNYWVSQGSLPAGLTLDIDGIISGTPTDVSNPGFIVTISDNFLNECSQDLTLAVTGPKFTNGQPPDGTECLAYSFQFTAVGTGAVTYSGTNLPCGLICDPATGMVTGYPCKKGSQSITISATDASGHTNNKTWTINVADDGTGIARSVADLGAWPLSGVPVSSFTTPPATVSYSAVGGSIQFNASVQGTPIHPNNSGAIIYNVINTLGRCASNPSKAVTVDVACTFNGTNELKQQIRVDVAGVTVHAPVLSMTGFTEHVVIPVLTDSPTIPNCQVLFDLEGYGTGPTQNVDCTLTITISQA